MNILETLIDAIYKLPLWQGALWLLLENGLIFGGTLLVGKWLVAQFKVYPVCLPPTSNALEIKLAISTVLLNALVTLLGLILWQQNIIHLRTTLDLRALLDVPILLLIMDVAMYALHRIAHFPLIYNLLHKTHHRFEEVRPLTLFALNPLENLSFGLLWLVVLSLYEASWFGITIYLALNVLFGLIGHLGVEPFPAAWVRLPLLKYFSTSTFHAQHHKDPHHNFGFYTLIWDKLFGTLSPRYSTEFGKIATLEVSPGD